jgi:predicted Abi (CAAX) family protease
MIPSGNLQHLHELFSGVTPGEWALFIFGILSGTMIWILFYQQVLKELILKLQIFLKKEVLSILLQSAMGAAIVFPNLLLFNYGELNRNFILAAFALTGILFGLWVFIPAE